MAGLTFLILVFVYMEAVYCDGLHRVRLSVSMLDQKRDAICEKKNAYYPVSAQCDAYVECRDWKAIEALCPDGLLFKPGTAYKTFPCVYPTDVSCAGRSRARSVLSSPECPHLFGFYRINDTKDCGLYKSCVSGKAYNLQCPDGLAFNTKTNQCEWPDLVEDCDVEEFIGFSCPGLFEEGALAPAPANYRHASDCRKYYACVNGLPRLLSCAADEVFNEITGKCEDSEISICIPSQ